nr:hypothetical protein [Tanacetum cinerariifolium]
MESLSPQVVAAAKLPILNPNEFDLWKIRIEQYFLMTDYSLWEVILNGDSPTPTRVVNGVVQAVALTTAEQRLAKKNELKASGTLLMALPDKHQLKFNTYKDAKYLIEAIEKRFGGNKETKKVQKTLLKQQYENFSGSSSESLDQIHNRLQKLISQLKILGESLSQEDINLKFFKSLPIEWRTYTLIWRNKTDLKDQSLDDLFNNLKIYEDEVKSLSSTSQTTQNIAFGSSQNTDSTNESVSVVTSVSAASTKVIVSTLPNVDNLSDAEMDLKWQMAMLTMRAMMFLQRTERNLKANGTTSIRFDMSKVKCYNYHRRGHFARECRSPKDTRNKDTQRRNVPMETSTSNALVSQCNGVGSYDWSFQADEEPTNYALIAFTSSSSTSSSGSSEVTPYSKACSKAYATLQNHYDKLTVDFRKSQFDVLSYKTGLESIEARLVVYQQNENVFKEDIKLLKLDVMLRDNALVKLRKKFEKAKKERDELKLTLENFHTSSKNLMFDCDELISSESDVSVPTSPLYDSETVPTVFNVKPSTTKPTKTSVKPVEPPTPAENLRKDIPKSRGHKNSWNRKACFVCKSVNHLIKDFDYYEQKMLQKPVWNHAMRVNHQNSARMTHPHSKKHVVPTSVLTRSRLVPLNAARLVTTTVPQPNVKHHRPAKHVVNKPHSSIKRPINHRSSPKNSNFLQKVTTVKAKQVNAIQGAKGNWGNPQQALKDKEVIDSGCSRHITRNISYLSDFEEINGGYVAFGGNPKGGKITSKDTECIILSSDFKLPDENHVLLRVPRENNMYNVDLKNIVTSRDLTCLFVKATLNESNLWHRRLGHINFKTMNKLVKGNLVRGLPSKVFENNLLVLHVRRESNIEPLNRVLVTKPHNKTPYELLLGRKSSIGFMRLFCCPVIILNTLDPLGKFDRKSDEGFLVGYSVSSKAFRVFNSRTRIVQEILHINFLENQPNVAGSGPTWLFDVDTLTQSMNYQLVVIGNQPNHNAGIQESLNADLQNTDVDAAFEVKEPESAIYVSPSSSERQRNMMKRQKEKLKERVLTNGVNAANTPVTAVGPNSTNSTNSFSAVGPSNIVVSLKFEIGRKSSFVDPSQYPDDPNMPALEDITYSHDEEDVGAEADFSNLETRITGHTREEGIDYEEVFALVARIEAIRTIEEEVYVCQPPGFKDLDYPDKGKIDQTLFIKKQKGDILLVQVYVDDIIFGSTNKDLCKAFEKLMKDKFQMSSMGELTFFLGLHVKQEEDGIFISQDKDVPEILRKFGLTNGKSASTPIDTEKPLLKDSAVKRIFRYLKGKPHLGLWYPKDSPFNLVAYSDSDYAGASLDKKSTTGGCQFLARIGYEKPSTKLTFYKAFFSAQWKFLIHIILQCISAKRTVWNEFSSSMASAVIFLATGRKFNFSKYIFDSLVRNVDSPSKFLMYPRFLQLMINAQVGNLSSHNTKYTSPTLTQKVFANMRRIGKGFSGVDIPLFDEGKITELDADKDVTLVDAEEEMNADVQGRLAESQAKENQLVLQLMQRSLFLKDSDGEDVDVHTY